jgi:hypothetical protein
VEESPHPDPMWRIIPSAVHGLHIIYYPPIFSAPYTTISTSTPPYFYFDFNILLSSGVVCQLVKEVLLKVLGA